MIRKVLLTLPGDVYSQQLLISSIRNIQSLGFFESLPPDQAIEINPRDDGDIDLVFRVRERQTGPARSLRARRQHAPAQLTTSRQRRMELSGIRLRGRVNWGGWIRIPARHDTLPWGQVQRLTESLLGQTARRGLPMAA